jgi:cation-transporting ATPase 13A3/4/5
MIEITGSLNRTVGMVGDGANDCGALKQADSGLDLSETETSISAPFTSSVLNVGSVITLLRNGRAALSTNFQCFKFMALYSLIQYVSTIILSFTFAEFSDMQVLTNNNLVPLH